MVVFFLVSIPELRNEEKVVEFAFIAKQAASYLEYLSDKRGALMKEIAAKSDLWPVNLGLRARVVKSKLVHEITDLPSPAII